MEFRIILWGSYKTKPTIKPTGTTSGFLLIVLTYHAYEFGSRIIVFNTICLCGQKKENKSLKQIAELNFLSAKSC